jgi:hypothetical protein
VTTLNHTVRDAGKAAQAGLYSGAVALYAAAFFRLLIANAKI